MFACRQATSPTEAGTSGTEIFPSFTSTTGHRINYSRLNVLYGTSDMPSIITKVITRNDTGFLGNQLALPCCPFQSILRGKILLVVAAGNGRQNIGFRKGGNERHFTIILLAVAAAVVVAVCTTWSDVDEHGGLL
jgi:hypothetical protein